MPRPAPAILPAHCTDALPSDADELENNARLFAGEAELSLVA